MVARRRDRVTGTEGTMPHDKITAATRKRMAQTGESYAAARREIIRERQAVEGRMSGSDTQWFAISFSKSVSGRITTLMDTSAGRSGPGKSGVAVGPDEIRVRMGGAKFDIPRLLVQSAGRSQEKLRGTTGVHFPRKGRLLVNGSADGLVEITIDPPFYTGRILSTLFFKERVNSLLVSLVDPDGFIAAVEDHGHK